MKTTTALLWLAIGQTTVIIGYALDSFALRSVGTLIVVALLGAMLVTRFGRRAVK
jgi:F0F1-type ATP synthase assembly protein I